MREISPALNCTADEYLRQSGNLHRSVVDAIRAEKKAGTRTYPSSSLIDESAVLTPEFRRLLIDRVAQLTDENLFGRSDMCIQFAILLERALRYLRCPATAIAGQSIYFCEGKEIFRWDHAWVRSDAEVIDANVDSIYENPMVPDEVRVRPYWGPVEKIPSDRRLRENGSARLPIDDDVDNIWWPELRDWLDTLRSDARS